MASYRLFTLARGTDWKVLPMAGGWLNQPQWWLDDVDYFLELTELIRGTDALPSALGLPKLEEMAT